MITLNMTKFIVSIKMKSNLLYIIYIFKKFNFFHINIIFIHTVKFVQNNHIYSIHLKAITAVSVNNYITMKNHKKSITYKTK